MEVLFSFDFQVRFMRPLSLVAKCLAIKLVARMNGLTKFPLSLSTVAPLLTRLGEISAFGNYF